MCLQRDLTGQRQLPGPGSDRRQITGCLLHSNRHSGQKVGFRVGQRLPPAFTFAFVELDDAGFFRKPVQDRFYIHVQPQRIRDPQNGARRVKAQLIIADRNRSGLSVATGLPDAATMSLISVQAKDDADLGIP